MKQKIFKLCLFYLLIILSSAQEFKEINIGKITQETLTSSSDFKGYYYFQVKNQSLKQWFVFVDVEPKILQEWESTQIKLSYKDKVTKEIKVKTCQSNSGIDTCELSQKDININERINMTVTCKEQCEFTLSSNLDTKMKIQLNNEYRLHFGNSPYSKLFSLNCTNKKIDELRIILKSRFSLNFPAPIRLYMDVDPNIPTKENHRYSAIHLWDDGVGIILGKNQINNSFIILVQGPEQNQLKFSVKGFNFTQVQKFDNLYPYFDYLGANKDRTYEIKNYGSQIVINLQTFSGGVEFSKIYDANQKQLPSKYQPTNKTYGMVQLILSDEFFKNLTDFEVNGSILVKIHSFKQSTFVISSYQNNVNIRYLMPSLTYDSDLIAGKNNQYYLEYIEMDKILQIEKNIVFQFIFDTSFEVNNTLQIQFWQCKKSYAFDCAMNKSSSQNKSDFFPLTDNYTQYHLVDGSRMFLFTIPQKNFRTYTTNFSYIIINVLIKNPSDNQQSYTLKCIQNGRKYRLKEKQIVKGRVIINQTKHFTFTNNDNNVTDIKVHMLQISGKTLFRGSLTDTQNDSSTLIDPISNTIVFKNVTKNQTIYIFVTGIDSSYFSLTLQLIRSTESNKSQQNSTGYNELILQPDVSQEFIIKANEKVIFQMHTKTWLIHLNMRSTLPLNVCMTEKLTTPPFDPNCEIKQKLIKKISENIKMERGNICNIGITNNNNQSVIFNIQFSAFSNKIPTLSTGQVHHRYIGNKSEQITNFGISRISNLQVVVNLETEQYKDNKITLLLNKTEQILPMTSQTHYFSDEQIQNICPSIKQVPCILQIKIESKTASSYDMLVQYTDQEITLVDGIAFNWKGKMTEKQPKHFVYRYPAKKKTAIIVDSKRGYYKFYGELIKFSDYNKKNFSFPTSQGNADINSSQSSYYYSSHLVVTYQGSRLDNQSCKDCILVISVYADASYTSHLQNAKFSIECTQQNRLLKDNTPLTAYLQKNSLDFYEYFSDKKKGSFIISIDNENRNCLNIYLSQGTKERATSSNYYKKAQSKNQLLFQLYGYQSSFSITLKANHDCPYTIEIFSFNTRFKNIYKDRHKNLQLNISDVQFFLFQNNINESFKILSILTSGQIEIHLKPFQINESQKILSQLPKKQPKYPFSGYNSILINKNNSKFCVNCYYLIKIKAIRSTSGSFIIPALNQKISLSTGGNIRDILPKGNSTKYTIYTNSIGKFLLNIQYGSLNMMIKRRWQKDIALDQNYTETNETINQSFEFNESDDYYQIYSVVTITALKDVYYSFTLLKTQKSNHTSEQKVQYGIPKMVNISYKSTVCLNGILDNNEEVFLLSSSSFYRLENLKTSCKVNEKNVQLQQKIISRSMMIYIKDAISNLPLNYSLCFKSSSSFTFQFIHSSNLVSITQLQSLIIRNQINLTFYSNGSSILEINQCQGKAIVLVSSSFNKLTAASSQISQRRKGNSIIQFYYFGPIYINIQLKLGTIRWIEDHSQFNAYKYFEASNFKLNKNQTHIKVQINPLKKININEFKNTTSLNLSYQIIAVKNEEQMRRTFGCSKSPQISSFSKMITSQLNKQEQVSFKINELSQQFKKQTSFIIAVIARMNTNISSTPENYRFTYQYHLMETSQISSTIPQPQPMPEPQQNKGNNDTSLSTIDILLIVLALIIVILLSVVCYKVLLRKYIFNRTLKQSEDDHKYIEFSSTGN